MTQSSQPSQPPSETRPPESDPDRSRGGQMMVAGMTVAVLAPLLGFLAGSMIGPVAAGRRLRRDVRGAVRRLVVGGIGAVVGGLGLLKFARRDSQEPWHL